MLNIEARSRLLREAATLGWAAISTNQRPFEKAGISLMSRTTLAVSLLVSAALFSPAKALPQGETTGAIIGHVTDATSATIPGALVTITNRETGLQRSAQTDDEGRFNFPQLKPGSYSVTVEAAGFDSQKDDNVLSGLGQRQTVNFTLKVAKSQQTVEVSGEPPLINSENANTSTNLNAPALVEHTRNLDGQEFPYRRAP
jgi:hypothetical protein